MYNPITKEPVLLQGVIQASLGLAVAFGLHLTQLQMAAILAFTAAALALITRTLVTPISK